MKKKKIIKKMTKKAIKPKKVVKTKKKVVKVVKPVKFVKQEKPIGKVTHFFGGINVAVVKFSVPTSCGTKLYFHGATTDFKQLLVSMEKDHKKIKTAKKGFSVGIKVKDKTREGDKVYKVVS